MWIFYALLSAIFASLTAIFAKIGIKGVNSDLATAIRALVILFITWGIVLFGNQISMVKELTTKNWIFLIISGVATGLSWLFYFRAIQLGEVSKVAPLDKMSIVFTILLSFLILKEPISLKVIIGGLFIAIGGIIIMWK